MTEITQADPDIPVWGGADPNIPVWGGADPDIPVWSGFSQQEAEDGGSLIALRTH